MQEGHPKREIHIDNIFKKGNIISIKYTYIKEIVYKISISIINYYIIISIQIQDL